MASFVVSLATSMRVSCGLVATLLLHGPLLGADEPTVLETLRNDVLEVTIRSDSSTVIRDLTMLVDIITPMQLYQSRITWTAGTSGSAPPRRPTTMSSRTTSP